MINRSEKRQLSEKAVPFVQIWREAQNFKAEEDSQYCILTTLINVSLQDAVANLRDGSSDFVFIHGVGKAVESYGLLCTDTPRQLADNDSCFFVGEIKRDEKEAKSVVLNTYQLNEFCGADAKYRVGDLVVMDSDEVVEASAISFLMALDEAVQ